MGDKEVAGQGSWPWIGGGQAEGNVHAVGNRQVMGNRRVICNTLPQVFATLLRAGQKLDISKTLSITSPSFDSVGGHL